MAIGALVLTTLLAGASAPPVRVEQLPGSSNSVDQPQASQPARQSTAVDQLPSTARPLHDASGSPISEAKSIPPPPPPGLPEEVRRAWLVLTLRGETPTADSLLAFLGPETMTRLFGQPSLPPSVLALLNPETGK